jgi:SAM-dependent methyltransferase
MLQLLSGYWLSQTLYVLAELRIADHLRMREQTAAELASQVAADAPTLQRLLRALASVGVLVEREDGRFANTALSATLDGEREGSLRPVALLGGHPLHWGAWGRLLDAVRGGGCAFEAHAAEPWFAALAREPALLASVQHIHAGAVPTSRRWLDQLSLDRFERIVDVGGGFGGLAGAIAAACPRVAVTLFDRPEVVDAAPHAAGIARVGGDFFDAVPEGDALVLRFVLHDWDDARASRLLDRCARALRAGGRLFVIESLLPAGPGASIAKTHDVNMLVLTGGRERTLADYRALLAGAGLSIERHLPAAHGGPDVLEAVTS